MTILTVQETAERLKCNPSTVIRLIGSGRLKAIDISPAGKHRCWRVYEESIADLAFNSQPEKEKKRSFSPKPGRDLISRFMK